MTDKKKQKLLNALELSIKHWEQICVSAEERTGDRTLCRGREPGDKQDLRGESIEGISGNYCPCCNHSIGDCLDNIEACAISYCSGRGNCENTPYWYVFYDSLNSCILQYFYLLFVYEWAKDNL